MAEFQDTIPFNANVCKIPTDAEELWITAVITAPTIIPRIGFLPSVVKACAKIGASRYGLIASDIKLKPINRTPKPIKISATWRNFSFFENNRINAPTPISTGAKNSGFNIAAHSPIDTSHAVIVVPMFAPIITPTACVKFKILALTKPTTITVVADEL